MSRVSQMTLLGGKYSYRRHLFIKLLTSSVPEYELNKDLLVPLAPGFLLQSPVPTRALFN